MDANLQQVQVMAEQIRGDLDKVMNIVQSNNKEGDFIKSEKAIGDYLHTLESNKKAISLVLGDKQLLIEGTDLGLFLKYVILVNTLALVKQSQNKPSEAEPLFLRAHGLIHDIPTTQQNEKTQAIVNFKTSLGVNIVRCFIKQRKYTEAVPYFRASTNSTKTDEECIKYMKESPMFAQDRVVVDGRKCANCCRENTPTGGDLKQCSVCKTTLYCSSECQKAHWKIHKIKCSKV
jgi:hypothetical protein